MSLVLDIFKSRKSSRSMDASMVGRATEYKVIDEDFVEGVTVGKEGSVIVVIRRGSLDLPAPEKPTVDMARTSRP